MPVCIRAPRSCHEIRRRILRRSRPSLRQRRDADVAWQEYKARHPDGCQYSAFCRDYEAWLGRQDAVMRFEHTPGDKLFVDYAGKTMALVDRYTGIDRAALGQVTDLGWIRERLHVIVTGPTGVSKSFLACAIGHAACRADHSVRCFRLPRLIDELTRHAVLQTKSTFLRQIAKADLLILDDFGLKPLPDQFRRDLLEIFDDRYDRRSTLITSQLPIEQWHAYLEDPTLADAILDRLIHNSYRLALKGDSMRKQKTAATAKTTKGH